MKDVNKWIDEIKKKKDFMFDLSKDEDLSIGIMNLISLEEHFYFSAMKTGNKNCFDMLNTVRALRIKMLKKMVKDPFGEEWCISKHLLAASMRLIEVGTKELSKNNKTEADEYFELAFELYSLFFAINLKIIDTVKIQDSIPESEKDQKSQANQSKFSQIVKKIVNCCKEW